MILSQLVAGRHGGAGRGRSTSAAGALRGARDAGYAAVREPQEGTILTVARALAERAEALDARAPRSRTRSPRCSRHGEDALARTPEQLDDLTQAGVVDAGGAGLLEIVRGIAAHVRGEPLPEPAPAARAMPLEAVHQELSTFRYCTSFFVEGEARRSGRARARAGEARRLAPRRRRRRAR